MNNLIKNFINRLRDMRLTETERAQIRSSLKGYMREYPLALRETSTRFAVFSLFTKHPVITAALIVLIIGVGGGTSFASEGSLPGSLLYPIKIHVNENVRSALTFSTEDKVAWALERAERRLDEVETLISQDKFDEENTIAFTAQFRKYTTSVKSRIDELNNDQDLTAAILLSSEYEATLHAHERLLAQLPSIMQKRSTASLLALVQSETKTGAALQADIINEIKAQPQTAIKKAAEGKRRAIENKIAEVQKFSQKKNPPLASGTSAVVQQGLTDADELITQGDALLEEDSSAAFELFHEAQRSAQNSKLLAKAPANMSAPASMSETDVGLQNTSTASSTDDFDDEKKTEDKKHKNGNNSKEK